LSSVAAQSILSEVHTTDLMTACPKLVQLRHEGKTIKEAPGAMFLGSLFHEAARILHERSLWAEDETGIVAESLGTVLEMYRSEGKLPTPAVMNNLDGHAATVARWIGLYSERFAGYFARCKVLGLEVPVRCSIDVDGYPVEFASHMDILFRDEHGMLCFWDWKTGEDSPAQAFLERNMQLGMYAYSLLAGTVRIFDEWESMGELALGAWIHVRNLAPYSRATQAKDDAGEKRQFVKGDQRPLRSVVREQMYTNLAPVVDQFATRVRMYRAGLFPAFADPEACRYCEGRMACPSWVSEPTVEEEGSDATV